MANLQDDERPGAQPRLDRTRDSLQGDLSRDEIGTGEDWAEGAVHRGRLRVRTLVTLRWMVVIGETAVLLVALRMGFVLPFPWCFAVVGAGAWINLLTGFTSPGQRVFGDREAAAQLSLDILQMSALVFLTGGASNPFMLMLIAPVTLAGATLPLRPVLILGVMAGVLSAILAFASLPLPEAPGASVVLPLSYRVGAAVANIAGIALTAGYVRQAAGDSAPLAPALDVPHAGLAREQRARPGALAAAAAHELGTPLAAISIVARNWAGGDPGGEGRRRPADLPGRGAAEILRASPKPHDAARTQSTSACPHPCPEEIERTPAQRRRVEAIVTSQGDEDTDTAGSGNHPRLHLLCGTPSASPLPKSWSPPGTDARPFYGVRDDGPGFSRGRATQRALCDHLRGPSSRTGHINGSRLFIARLF